MRDNRFIAKHRGGLLTKKNHQQLMLWACACIEHVLPLFGGTLDERLTYAIMIAKDWAKGNTTVGDAMKASVGAHAVARELTNPTSIAVARAVGQAVATAHMADHSLGAAFYALKAIKNAGKSIESEREWQNEQLPPEIKEIVLNARTMTTGKFQLS
ncbi:MAG: hypothetical protein IPH69_12830 [Bacteroidales bacterium]|nr:hypothetical protein [Bacteroidales bacterium]